MKIIRGKANPGTVEKALSLLLILFLYQGMAPAQVHVGLDNWFNHEKDPVTGKPFHYLWTDTALSGYSQWGDLFTQKGAVLSTIKKPTAVVLSKLNLYIIVDPDTTSENPSPNYILPGDIAVIDNWVKLGGVLVLLANDGPNCEFTHLNNLARHFGMIFNPVTLHRVTNDQWNMAAFTGLPDHPVFKGVHKIYMKEISSISVSPPARPVLTENGKTFMAEARYGKGFVFAIGDPWIYNEYIDHARLPVDFENKKAANNFTDYLLIQARTRAKK